MHKQAAWMVVLGTACVAVGLFGASRQGREGAPAGAAPGTFLIKDARVFDGERMIERTSVLVRDGKIAALGGDADGQAGIAVVDGSGRTLLPGLIDAHTHAFGDALERALVFGVTTELDMFTSHQAAAGWRAAQRGAGIASRADIFSAGTLVTAPKGHGTEYGMPIPTIASAGEAAAFVDARLAEGSDYIKIVYEDGAAYGMKTPTIGSDVLRAVIAATKRRGKLAVVHIGSRAAAEEAIAAGASGLVHLFADRPPTAEFVRQARDISAFVIPTLSVIESVSGTPGSKALAEAASVAPFLTPAEKAALGASFPTRPGMKVDIRVALDATRQLHAAGVPVLAGTDAPNPGTSHGVTIHHELELLVRAGLSPSDALAAATATPARIFGLTDRGRIAPGLRADLVLVTGDPTRDITATRSIAAVWKGGIRLDRRHAAVDTPAALELTSGAISDFEKGDDPTAAFGAGWQVSTDSMMGGASEAVMRITRPGAGGAGGALEVTGAVNAGAPFPWAGAMFFPASTPMTPVNLSRFTSIAFRARGDGREYQVMVFATRLGNIPAAQPFRAGPDWQEFVMPFASFGNVDGSDLRGILFSADAAPGRFRLVIDDVRLQ